MIKSPAMKNRYTAPFGYAIEMGKLTIHPSESEIVRQIFASYLAGASLKTIADDLAVHEVEYLPGESAWNKNRIKRILEDARYLGSGEFPALVDEADFHTAQSMKHDRNDRKAIQPENHISQISLPVVCAACGTAMKRTHHTKRKIHDAWECPCGAKVRLADSGLLAGISEILNRLIAEPTLIIEEEHQPDEERQLEIRRQQNEIGRQLEGFEFDRDAVQKDIFTLAVAKYKNLPDHATTYLLRAAFEKSAPLASFSRELLEATAKRILLGSEGIFIMLKNGQTIGKDDNNGSGITENGAHDPGKAGSPAA